MLCPICVNYKFSLLVFIVCLFRSAFSPKDIWENLMQTGFRCRLSQEVTSALNHSQKCMYTQIFTFAAT